MNKVKTQLRLILINFFLIVIFLFYFNLNSFSQKTYLAGTIYDYEKGTSIGECKVSLLVNTKGKYYLTDTLGKFGLSMLCDIIDTLIIEKEGYCPLQISNIDPAFVTSKNDLVFYLKKEKNDEGAFLSLYPKKFLGITYKKVLEHDFFNYSTCCQQNDSTYYTGMVINKLSMDLLNKCYYNTEYSEIIIKTQEYYNNNPDSMYFPEFDSYASIISLIDSSGPCKIIKDIDPYYDRYFEGGGTQTYARYLKEEIIKLNIRHQDTIFVDFILEYPFGYSNINISGVHLHDRNKIEKIIMEGPKWSPPRSRGPRIRLLKQVIIDMTDVGLND